MAQLPGLAPLLEAFAQRGGTGLDRRPARRNTGARTLRIPLAWAGAAAAVHEAGIRALA